MATNTPHRFNNVYISDVWNMTGSVYVTSLTLLRGIFTKSVIIGKNTIIDFLETICTRKSRIHFISRGVKFHNNQYIALWPEKKYVLKRARKIFEKLQTNLGRSNLERVQRIANRLNTLVVALANSDGGIAEEYLVQFNELREEYYNVQNIFDDLYGNDYDNNIQYKLTKFGNEISIVFQNYQADRNVLFTGDFGKKRNWLFIEKNQDGLVKMHPYYEVIKVPHHGTASYYHSFLGKIQSTSIFMISNGCINQPWYVSPQYKKDSLCIRNRTICASNIKCSTSFCPKGKCIYPDLYIDI